MWLIRRQYSTTENYSLVTPADYHAMMQRNNPFTVKWSAYIENREQAEKVLSEIEMLFTIAKGNKDMMAWQDKPRVKPARVRYDGDIPEPGWSE